MLATNIQFETDLPVADVLRHDIQRISCALDRFGKCACVTLWWNQSGGVRISSQMHDVADKLEIGVLKLQLATTIDPGEVIHYFVHALKPTQALKLLITCNKTTLESGLQLHFSTGQQLAILPADFPFFLSIQGNCVPVINPVSEYSLTEYTPSKLF